MTMLELNDISKNYGMRCVISHFSCCFPQKGLVLLMGESGCGKTTLLRLMARLEIPSLGKVHCDEPVHAMCFQEYRLFPQLSALENVWRLSAYYPDSHNRKEAADMLMALGFGKEELDRRPAALSGGMKQRVSLARTLCTRSDTVLLDEPLKELDSDLRRKAMDLILRRARQDLVIMTVHDTL